MGRYQIIGQSGQSKLGKSSFVAISSFLDNWFSCQLFCVHCCDSGYPSCRTLMMSWSLKIMWVGATMIHIMWTLKRSSGATRVHIKLSYWGRGTPISLSLVMFTVEILLTQLIIPCSIRFLILPISNHGFLLNSFFRFNLYPSRDMCTNQCRWKGFEFLIQKTGSHLVWMAHLMQLRTWRSASRVWHATYLV